MKSVAMVASFFMVFLCLIPSAWAADELSLVSVSTPTTVGVNERFQLVIHYKSDLPPEQIKKRIRNVYVTFEGGGRPNFDSKIDAVKKAEFISVADGAITLDRMFFAKPRDGCVLKITVEYGESKKTNTVASLPIQASER